MHYSQVTSHTKKSDEVILWNYDSNRITIVFVGKVVFIYRTTVTPIGAKIIFPTTNNEFSSAFCRFLDTAIFFRNTSATVNRLSWSINKMQMKDKNEHVVNLRYSGISLQRTWNCRPPSVLHLTSRYQKKPACLQLDAFTLVCTWWNFSLLHSSMPHKNFSSVNDSQTTYAHHYIINSLCTTALQS